MATDLPQAEPSEGLRDRIRRRGRADRAAARRPRRPTAAPAEPARAARSGRRRLRRHPPGRAEPRSRWRRAVPLGLVAAGVAAIVGLGIWNVVLTTDRSELQATVAEQSAV